MRKPETQVEAPPGRRAAGPASWAGVGALVFAILAMWSLALPLMASPDEPSHVVKAAAVARGQWSGVLGPPPSDTSRPGAATVVQLPADLAASPELPTCYAFQPDVPADCVPDVPARTGADVPTETFAGQYPPLYYALVGWPSLLLAGEAAMYGMRLASALISAVMLTWGAYRMSTLYPGRLAVWGAVAAATPMCLFLGGTVNPNGWEITTAFSFWAACLALVAGAGRPRVGALLQVGVSGALLVNIRDSSPFWALVIVVIVAVLAPPGRLAELVRHRLMPWLAGLAVLAGVAAILWATTHGDAVSARGLYPRYADRAVAALEITGSGFDYLQRMIGDFGWLDTPAPPVTFVSWYVVVGALVLIAASSPARAGLKAGLVLLLLGVAAAPYLQLPTAADAGLIWQGRYALPLAVGVPLVAAVVVGQQRPEIRDFLRRVFHGTLVLAVVGQVAGFYWALRRYSEGLTGDLITVTPDWSSPVGYLSGSLVYALLWLALAAVIWRGSIPAVTPARPGGAPGDTRTPPHRTEQAVPMG